MAITVSADDFGLTRANTDTILEAAERSPLSKISILANGEAFDYAIERYVASKALRLAVHVNLTEGPAVGSGYQLLTDSNGSFRHSVLGLLLRYAVAGNTARAAYRREIAAECASQVDKVRAALASHGREVTEADGHQHVHLLPFVFESLIAVPGIRRVRIVREPWHVTFAGLLRAFGPRALALALLNALSRRAATVASRSGIRSNDRFVGFLFSGSMTYASSNAGLAAVARRTDAAQETELLLHPGSAASGELSIWRRGRADIAWHYSSNRVRERSLLESARFKALVANGSGGDLFGTIVRFGMSGSLVAVVDLGSLYILASIFGIQYVLAASIAFCIAFVVSYTLQKFWTFRSGGQHAKHVPAYFLLQLVNLVLNAALLYAVVSWLGIPYLIAEFFILIVLAVESFTIMRSVIFRPAPTNGARDQRLATPWLDFWNTSSHVYVSQRHLDAHFSKIAEDVVALVPDKADPILLDWGCGDAYGAPLMAHRARVYLYDPAPAVTERIRARFKDVDRIIVLDAADVDALKGRADMLVVNSVLQYISKEEFKKLLPGLRSLLAPDGALYLGDVVPPGVSMKDDTESLLKAAARHGFLLAALLGLVKTLFSDYRRIRKEAGFTMWREEEIVAVLEHAGFSARRVPGNIGLSPHRMLIRATL